MAKCTATSKRSGKRCKKDAVVGRKTCHMHSGTAPRGLAHPSTKHAKYTKDMPTRLVADVERALADPDLISLRLESAITSARMNDLLARVDPGEAGILWRKARAAMADFRAAQRADDAPAAATALRELEDVLGRGVQDYAAWDEWFKAVEMRRRLADTERRRLEALEYHITKQQGALLVARVYDIVSRHVADPKVLGAIGRELEPLIDDGERPGEESDEGPGGAIPQGG